MEEAGRRPAPRFIDVNEAFCDDGVCRARVGDRLTYFDNNHLSATRSRALKGYFAESIRAIS